MRPLSNRSRVAVTVSSSTFVIHVTDCVPAEMMERKIEVGRGGYSVWGGERGYIFFSTLLLPMEI